MIKNIFLLFFGFFFICQCVYADSDMVIAESLTKFLSESGAGWEVKQNPKTGVIEQLKGGKTSPIDATSPLSAATKFLSENIGLFLGSSGDIKNVTVNYMKENLMGSRVIFKQLWNNKPVFGCEIFINLNKNYEVFQIDSTVVPIEMKDRPAKLDSEEAITAAKKEMGVEETGMPPTAVLGVYPGFPPVNAWKVKLLKDNPKGLWEIIVNGQNGEIISKENMTRYNK